jgi:branched-chain amino acid aminotransferase
MSVLPFDDRDGKIWMDGKLVDWRDAKLHVLSHGLHYGSCVFEGERVYNGEVFKLQEHNERLHRSAELLGFKIPYTVEELNEATIETVKAAGYTNAYVRPVAWRGSEMMAISAQKTTIHVAIAVWEWPSYFSKEAREQGLKLRTSEWRRPSPKTAPSASKAAGLYMICTMSKHSAEAAGFHDALMLDYKDRVAEATGANIFLVQNGELHTPTPECILNGITRQTVMQLARDAGIKVVEREILPEEFAKTQEVFLTGSAAEVTPVGAIDDYKFTVGPVTRRLMDDYTNLVMGVKKAA